MAFNLGTFQIACASVDNSMNLCTYRTTDTSATVKTTGYFDDAPIKQGDIILIGASDITFIAQKNNTLDIGKTIAAIKKFDGSDVL